MSGVNIPQEYLIHLNPVVLAGGVGIGLNGVLTLDLGLDDVAVSLTGDPNHPIKVDLGLDNIHVKLDKVELQLDPIELKLDPVKMDLGLDNVNVCLSLAITQCPSMRMHIPTKYDFGFCLLGIPVFKFTVCGETDVVTQDNPPRIFHKIEAPEREVAGAASPKAGHDEPFRIAISEEGH